MTLKIQAQPGAVCASLHCQGAQLYSPAEPCNEELPSFKSGDLWLVELRTHDEARTGPVSVVEPVRIWINPEEGEIKVTLLGVPRRQPFSVVKRWLVKLEVLP